MSRYIEDAELDNWFGYHPPSSEDIANGHDFVRRECRELAGMLNKILPEGAEKTTALRKVREAAMWGNAAIACKQEVGDHPWVARVASITVTPVPETVYVNVLADPRTVAEFGHWIGESIGEAVAEVFGSITPEQNARFEAAVNAAIQKTIEARDFFDREGHWPNGDTPPDAAALQHEQCRQPANGNPLHSLIISNQCLRCVGHEGACTADAREAERMGC